MLMLLRIGTTGAVLDAADEILMADPGYPCNRHFASFIDAVPVRIPVGPETAFQLTPQLVERHWTDRTRAVLLATPSNPTGTLEGDEDIRNIASLCAERGGILIVDEIYHGLVYEGSPQTALAHSDQVIRHQQLFQVFPNDRLAAGMAGGARAADGQHRALGAKPISGSAHDGTACRARVY